MTFDLAKSIIIKEADFVKTDPNFDELEIDFMGGEPLMNFNLIRQIVEWLDENPLPVPFLCFATTNGTLLDEEMKSWFIKYRKWVCLGASYDGSVDLQRKNRGADEHSIDFEFFHNAWPTQGFKLTISKDSLPNLASGIIESQKKGFRLVASLAQGIDWNDFDATCYLEQLRLLSEVYLSDPALTPVNLLSRPIVGISNPSSHQRRFCGTGVYMTTYDVDGRTYGCHMFSPIVLGEEQSLESSKVEWACDTIADDVRCSDCLLKDFCPTCVGFNYRFRGDLSKRDFRWCKMILAEAIASCEFQIKVLAARRNSLTEEEARLGQCALDALPFLSSFSVQKTEPPFRRGSSIG